MSVNLVGWLKARLEIRQAYRTLFESENPQVKHAADVVMRDLFKHGFITKSPFVPNDPTSTSRNLGAQRMLIHILERTYKDPQKLIEKVTQEHEH